MEGKLAKHSDFFPIIEFLHLKSLNSNSQQFHVLLLRFEILTVTDRSASQAGWMTFYYFTVLLSPNNTHYIHNPAKGAEELYFTNFLDKL